MCVNGPTRVSRNTDDPETASTSHDSYLNVCMKNAVHRALPIADSICIHLRSAMRQRSSPSSLVAGVVNVIERNDSDVVRFDGDPTCCAFHNAS